MKEEQKAAESKRAKEEAILNKELDRAKDLLKQLREKLEAANGAIKELSTELKISKADGKASVDMLSTEQERQQACMAKLNSISTRLKLSKRKILP